MKLHRFERDRTTTWQLHRVTIGRFKASVTVHRHAHPEIGDRWVVQPTFSYDRKPESSLPE